MLNHLVKACRGLGHTVQVGNVPPKYPPDWVEVWWGAPQEWQWSRKDVALRVAFTLSESDQLLKSTQERAVDNLQQADIILVPTPASLRCFQEMPIDKPLALWPLGFDPEVFRYSDRGFRSSPFRFLHLGVTQIRKGSWTVPEAFLRAFGSIKDTELTIASYGETEMWKQLAAEYGGHPQITFVAEDKEPPSHYTGQHVLVSPHLAEGWGLCIPEAMALGMICLVSRCSAPRDYFSEDYGWWIEMSDLYAPVSGCLPNTPGLWRLPDVRDLAAKMRYVYEHRGECEEKALVAAEWARKSLSWEIGCQQGLAKVEEWFH